MKKSLFVGACFGLGSLLAASPAWPVPTREMKPWVYNWWMGSAVDEAGLARQSAELAAKGFGGFHVIPIYGAKGHEKQYRSYLSPAWMEAFALAKRIGEKHNLGIDLSSGSGWCFGGPWLRPEDGGWQLERNPATRLLEPKPTGQRVKRAGPGGAGPMMNPFSPGAMRRFLAAFAPFEKPGAALPAHFYHDSYEYFRACWSPELAAAFRAKRGYDLMAKWDLFCAEHTTGAAREAQAALKCDWRETLSDLMVEDVFPLWVDWCHARGVATRNEAHGAPANLLDLYALADVPETEMFRNDRDVFISKFASSAAHVTGKPLVSAESCTWLGEHFRETLCDAKLFIDRLFLAGVNHMFYHGLCYSPVEAPWPGWCFYASFEMNPRNPIWRDAGVLNAYITRCQSVFQTAKPSADVLVYWPIRDLWWNADGLEQQLTVHGCSWFHGQRIGAVCRDLYAAGYSFDYVSDRMLQKLPALPVQTIVVPKCAHMPAATRAALAAWEKKGCALVWDDGTRAGVRNALAARGLRPEPFNAASGLAYTRFTDGADTLYFVVNTATQTVARAFAPTRRAVSAWEQNPLTGRIEPRAVRGGAVALALAPGHSTFLRVSPTPPETAPAPREELVTFDLGEVLGNESVRVTVNGTCVGTLIMPPYRISFPRRLLRGPRVEDNEIQCDVAARGFNRLRQMDIDRVPWKYFRDANMLSADYKPLDYSSWPPLEHGVKGPLRLACPSGAPAARHDNVCNTKP